MIKIKLKRTIKGKIYIKEMEEEHGSIEELKQIFKDGKGDMKLELDLEEWEYFLDHPEENLEQTRIIYDETPHFTISDLQILDQIKNKEIKSISDLAKQLNKDVSVITRNVNKLKEKGFIVLKEGQVNNMKTPVFNYDTIEIAI